MGAKVHPSRGGWEGQATGAGHRENGIFRRLTAKDAKSAKEMRGGIEPRRHGGHDGRKDKNMEPPMNADERR